MTVRISKKKKPVVRISEKKPVKLPPKPQPDPNKKPYKRKKKYYA